MRLPSVAAVLHRRKHHQRSCGNGESDILQSPTTPTLVSSAFVRILGANYPFLEQGDVLCCFVHELVVDVAAME